MTDQPGAAHDGDAAEDLVEFLADVPLFAPLDEELRTELASTAKIARVRAGDWLFHAGDEGDTFYAVWSGRLEVVGPDGNVVSVLGRGDALGEIALLTGDARSASVRAVRDSELLTIDREQFHRLLEGNSRFAVTLTTALGHRLARQVRTRPVAKPRRSILAVVPLAADLDVQTAVDTIVATVAAWGTVALLDGDVVDTDETTDAGLGRLLDRCERDNDVVLLRVRPGCTPAWRDFCLRQADRVLVLTHAGRSPTREEVASLQGCDLAFWTSTPPAPSRSRPWLDALQPRSRHWIPTGADQAAALQRTTRRLFGRAVGVVMSGGGARGLAHVGAVAALREQGITIDRFGGSSMGAYVSALLAAGHSTETACEILRRELVGGRPFADYTLPRVALIRSRRARRMFHRVFGDRQIEELPLDWFGITSDLLTAEVVVHRRGPVWLTVGASMSLPGLAPPVVWGDRMLVDGGVLNNLPVDVMARSDEGPVIAIEVMRRWKERWEERVAETKGPPPLPSMVETLSCATGLGSWRATEANRELTDLTITPQLADVGLLEWQRIDELVDRGRQAALTALEASGWSAGSPADPTDQPMP